MERRHAPGPRYAALLELLRTAEALWESSRIFFGRWELGPSQFNMLNVISGFPEGLSQTELSRRLIMHRSNVTGLVNRLEARHLVRRESCPEDRRAYRILLTEPGRKLLQQILPQYYAAAEQVWGDAPVARVNSLLRQMEELSRNAAKIITPS